MKCNLRWIAVGMVAGAMLLSGGLGVSSAAAQAAGDECAGADLSCYPEPPAVPQPPAPFVPVQVGDGQIPDINCRSVHPAYGTEDC